MRNYLGAVLSGIFAFFAMLPAFGEELVPVDFPYYPPSLINDPSIQGKAYIDTALQIREEALSFFEGKEQKQEQVDVMTSKVQQEFDRAMSQLMEQAARSGWKLLGTDEHMDMGSQSLEFAKMDRDQLHFLAVMFRQTAVLCGGERCEANDPEHWGKIEYHREQYHPPVQFRSFPLLIGISRLEDFVQTETEEGIRVTASGYPRSRPGSLRLQTELPLLFGWKRRNSALLDDWEALFEKDGMLVKLDGPMLPSFLFYKPELTGSVKTNYPEHIFRKEIVDSGYFILNGRRLLRPYLVELRDLDVYINNSLVESFHWNNPQGERLGARRALEAYQYRVNSLKNNCYSIEFKGRGEGSSSASGCRDAHKIPALVGQIDQIVKSRDPRAEKINKLKALEQLSGQSSENLEKFLVNWKF